MAMTPGERQARYKVNSRDKYLANGARYRQNNRAELRIKGRKRERERREKLRGEVLAALGDACAECGFDDARALHVDHVNDDGSIDRVEFNRNPMALLRHIIANIDSGRWQCLCANCNTIKQWERVKRERL